MPLNPNALTTLPLVKSWLKIPTTALDQDVVVEQLINGFSQEIEQATGRKIKRQAHVDLRHGRGSNIVLLKEWPVASIEELKIGEEVIDPLDYAIGDDQSSIVLLHGMFPRGYNNVRVAYTAGYDPVPSDLAQAVMDLCFWKYRTRESGDIGRRTKGKSGESEQWYQGWPEGVVRAVMRYKRSEVPGSDAPVWNS